MSKDTSRVTAPDGKVLPPIHRVKEPPMRHMSTRIRWYIGLGYSVKEISKFLGVLYQQVRNVATTLPKRAAREDVPAYIIECWELEDDLEAMESHALQVEMAAQRSQHRQERKLLNQKRKDLAKEAEAMALPGDLDDENYGRWDN